MTSEGWAGRQRPPERPNVSSVYGGITAYWTEEGAQPLMPVIQSAIEADPRRVRPPWAAELDSEVYHLLQPSDREWLSRQWSP